MIRSEDLKWNEDLLVIWGFRFPKKKIESKQAIHHALLLINNMAMKGNFRIVYFHTGVKGAGEKIPTLLKKIWKKMSKDMRSNLVSIDILNGNFSLKLSLFFFDKFSFTDYKIHFRQNDYEWLDIEQKTFILGSQPEEIKLYEAKKSSTEVSSVVGEKKIIRKDVVSTSDSKYKDFDVTNAVQTYDILGKHLYEFPKSEGEIIPDVFTTIFSYFYSNEVIILCIIVNIIDLGIYEGWRSL